MSGTGEAARDDNGVSNLLLLTVARSDELRGGGDPFFHNRVSVA